MKLKGAFENIKSIKEIDLKKLILSEDIHEPWITNSDISSMTFRDDIINSEFLLKLGLDKINEIIKEFKNDSTHIKEIGHIDRESPMIKFMLIAFISEGEEEYQKTKQSMNLFNKIRNEKCNRYNVKKTM